MSKSIISKIAAVSCSVVALGALGITAAAQNPVPADSDISGFTLTADKTNIIAGVIEAEPGETVHFPVYIANNAKSGFAATGLRLIYDAKLTPVTDEDGNLVFDKKCTAGDDVTKKFTLNAEKQIIGLGTMGSDPEKDNGIMYTVDIKVPADAEAGAKFPMTLEVDKWLDAKTNPLEYVTIDGYIFIAGKPTTDTTTTTTDTTTTTTTTTTAPITTTTAPITTTTAPVTDVTTTTSSSSGVTSTTTTTAGGNKVTTTAKKNNGGTSSNTTATKTGDAGVGVAVAGLLLAAGTAVVATKKKKD